MDELRYPMHSDHDSEREASTEKRKGWEGALLVQMMHAATMVCERFKGIVGIGNLVCSVYMLFNLTLSLHV